METRYVHFGMKGDRERTESYLLSLQYSPKTTQSGAVDKYTCSELRFQANDGPSVAIPELANFEYAFNPAMQAPVWGIPQERFFDLTDGRRPLPFETRYALYVNFLDFHSFNDIFTRPMPFGNGIQNLKQIGQRAIHPASFIEAPVGFGSEVQTGSSFKNGEISLELKGVSMIDGAPCALVAYDAGESKLRMITQDSEGKRSVTEGGSHYKGDLYVDLTTRWVRKATLDEYQVSQSSSAGDASRTDEYTVRHILLKSPG